MRTARLAHDVRTRCASRAPAARPGGHRRHRPRRPPLRRVPLEGAVGLRLLLARHDRRAHRERSVSSDRSVLVHLVRDAMDAARVAERAPHLPSRGLHRLHGRRLCVRVHPGHRDRDPWLRAPQAGPAHGSRRGGTLVFVAAGHPVRDASAPGPVVDHVRHPRGWARPPATGPLTLAPRTAPALPGVGEPPRPMGHRTGRAGGVHHPVPRRSHTDGRRQAVGARDGAARHAGDGVHAGGPVAPRLSAALRGGRGLGHGQHQRVAVSRLPRPGALAAASLHGGDGDLRPLAGPVVDEHPRVPRDRDDTGGAAERGGRGDPRRPGARRRDRRGTARLAADANGRRPHVSHDNAGCSSW